MAARPFYVPVGDEEQVFKAAFRQSLGGDAEGSDGMRQDALRRSHGATISIDHSSPCRATTT